MCPACVASAAVIVGGVTTTGGVSALLVKIFRLKKSEKPDSAHKETKRS